MSADAPLPRAQNTLPEVKIPEREEIDYGQATKYTPEQWKEKVMSPDVSSHLCCRNACADLGTATGVPGCPVCIQSPNETCVVHKHLFDQSHLRSSSLPETTFTTSMMSLESYTETLRQKIIDRCREKNLPFSMEVIDIAIEVFCG